LFYKHKYLKEKVNKKKISVCIENGKVLKEKIKKRIAKLDLSTLQKDVRPFLFDSNNQSVVLFDKIIEQTEFE